ncbi:MAG: ADP-ribosylglycohydrolase family protein [Spirochaetaceae bacterium]|nr:ADP-ribosylglycohydrolase family protein [Spirochaetaceae bacterium]
MPAEPAGIAEATYAGVLGKLIGVYLGRPVEGWAYEAIRERFGEVDRYVHEPLGQPLVVADDDLSGSFGFFRAVTDGEARRDPTAAEFGDTWLNTIIEDKTILWWGGFGRSTEHTAYLRLKAGYRAPQSGSSTLNGEMLATQIGAQIFTDPLALTSPGDPERASALIRKAASVSHDGVALDCAAYLGALQALAFEHRPLAELMAAAEPFVHGDQLRRLLDDVCGICSREADWRKVRAGLDPRHGYGVYNGPCPILTNHAMVLAALLLGGDDFRRAVMIAASAGYDTDCNAGSVGCLNGVRLGLAAIPADLREPAADRLLVVTAEGGRCVSDAVLETRRILHAGAVFRDRPGPPNLSGSAYGAESARGAGSAQGAGSAHGADAADDAGFAPVRRPRFGLELPGARQGFAPCPHAPAGAAPVRVAGSDQPGIELHYRDLTAGSRASVSTPVFLDFDQVADNFSTHASPTLYATQEVTVRLQVPATAAAPAPAVAAYVLYYDAADGVQRLRSPAHRLRPGANTLRWEIPDNGGMPLFRVGLELRAPRAAAAPLAGSVRLLSVDWDGAPRDFRQRGMLMSSIWNLRPRWLRAWVSAAREFAPDFELTYCVSHSADNGLVTLGTRDWRDYAVETRLRFSLHRSAGVVLRTRGLRRYYAAVFSGGRRLAIVARQDEATHVLAGADVPYQMERLYALRFAAHGDRLSLAVDGIPLLEASDHRYRSGGAGFVIDAGTMLADGFRVRRESAAPAAR